MESLKTENQGRALIIPALWEAEAGGSRGEEINMVKPHLYLKYKKLAGHCGTCL